MFAFLRDDSPLTAAEQATQMAQFIATDKQPAAQVMSEIGKEFPHIEKNLLLNPLCTLNLIFGKITKRLAFDWLARNQTHPVHRLLHQILNTFPYTQLISVLQQISRSHSQTEKLLIVLDCVGIYVPKSIPQDDSVLLTKVLAEFVATSALVIRNYFVLKNEPASEETDRIETDFELLQNAEEWVSKAYVNFFRNVVHPSNRRTQAALLVGFSEIVTELLEADRQNQINKGSLQRILLEVVAYCRKHYSLEQMSHHFLTALRSKNFHNPQKKIQIAADYSADSNLTTPGYCYLVLKCLQSTHYTPTQQLKWLLPAWSEILPTPYQLKVDITEQVISLCKDDTFSYGSLLTAYPLGLLLFNVHTYFSQYIGFLNSTFLIRDNPASYVHHMKYLLGIELGDKNAERNGFVLKQLLEIGADQSECLILLKSMRLESIAESQFKPLLEVFRKASQSERAKGVFRQIVSRSEQASRELYRQIEELI